MSEIDIDPKKMPYILEHLERLAAGELLSTDETFLPYRGRAYCYRDDEDCSYSPPVEMVHEMRDLGFVEPDPEYVVNRSDEHKRWILRERGRRFLEEMRNETGEGQRSQ